MALRLMDEKWLEKLPEPVAENMNDLNNEVIKIFCERIKAIGKLLPSDAHRLSNSLEYSGADLKKIEKAIMKCNKLNRREVRRIFEEAAKENERFAERFYQYRGLAPVTVQSDDALIGILQAITRNTWGALTNLSDTYAFKFPGEKAISLRRTYMRVIDQAIYEVQNGILDYNTAMRNTVKNLADSGIRVITWESGVTRRADTAARMNILDGVRRLNREMMNYNGEKFGADGIELSAHAISAPDHLPVQGRQFSNEQFEQMQAGKDCEDTHGNHYDGFERPIGFYNCKHFAIPIVIGASEPAYTQEQLESMAKNSREKYDITQQQRKKETELRRLKDRRMAYSAAGNELDAKRTQREIDKKQKEYTAFCKKNGILPKPERTQVAGYKRVSTKGLQDNYDIGIIKQAKSDMMKKIEMGELPLLLNRGNQNKHIMGSHSFNREEKKSYLAGGLEEAQKLVLKYYGTGELKLSKEGKWVNKEFIVSDDFIGYVFDNKENMYIQTKRFSIHYSKKGTHIVPRKEI